MSVQSDPNSLGSLNSPLTVESAHEALMKLWYAASAFIVVLILCQSATQKYGPQFEDHFMGVMWVSPLIMPTLVWMANIARQSGWTRRKVKELGSPLVFNISWWASLIYLLSVAAVPLYQPYSGMKIQDFFLLSSLFLLMFQGLVFTLLKKIFPSRAAI
jgi:hypothetical protein